MRPTPRQTPPRSWRLVVQYEGTAYSGWQRQDDAPSVQQTLEETLEGILQHPVRAYASGRTDAGVHALGQVVRIDTHAPHVAPHNLLRGANTYLPPDIRILSVDECAPEFDPRGDARLRWYRYSIHNGPVAPVLDRRRLTHVARALDWSRFDNALARFHGHHEFRAFRSSLCRARRTQLTMERIERIDAAPVHHLDFQCRSFLHNMIRLIAGLCIEIGLGRHRPEDVSTMLETGRRTAHWQTAPPQGLVLMEVRYDEPPPGRDAGHNT